MSVFSIMIWAIFGVIVGSIAAWVYPEEKGLIFWQKTLIGVGGSFVGGMVHYLIRGGEPLQASGWLASIAGAILILVLWHNRYSIIAFVMSPFAPK